MAVKKDVALFKMTSVKKVVKSKEADKKWLRCYRLMTKILITTILVNFPLIPSEAGMRQPELLLINFCN